MGRLWKHGHRSKDENSRPHGRLRVISASGHRVSPESAGFLFPNMINSVCITLGRQSIRVGYSTAPRMSGVVWSSQVKSKWTQVSWGNSGLDSSGWQTSSETPYVVRLPGCRGLGGSVVKSKVDTSIMKKQWTRLIRNARGLRKPRMLAKR